MKQKFINTYESLLNLDNVKNLSKEMKQQRGRDFESLINDVFEDEGILLNRSYHTIDNSAEQIDGAIMIEPRIFLLEIKWVKSTLAASELYAFFGKIDNKFTGTLGIFISKAKLSENFLNALNKGRRQSVIVIHGDDIKEIFSNHSRSLKDYISHIVKLASYDNRTHFSFKEYLEIVQNNKISTNTLLGTTDDFIKNILLKKTATSLIEEFDNLTISQKNEVFKYSILNYAKYRKLGLAKLDLTATTKMTKLFTHYIPEESLIIELAQHYYGNLLSENVEIFYSDVFRNLFYKSYNELPVGTKSKFESEIYEKLKFYNNSSNWNCENYVTESISPIWDKLENKENFKSIYLKIFIRNSGETFPQKIFAQKLIENNEIDSKFAEDWIGEELRQFKKSNTPKLTSEYIEFFARAYLPLNKIIKSKDWLKFIVEKEENIS
jgi:hypothetical protein